MGRGARWAIGSLVVLASPSACIGTNDDAGETAGESSGATTATGNGNEGTAGDESPLDTETSETDETTSEEGATADDESTTEDEADASTSFTSGDAEASSEETGMPGDPEVCAELDVSIAECFDANAGSESAQCCLDTLAEAPQWGPDCALAFDIYFACMNTLPCGALIRGDYRACLRARRLFEGLCPDTVEAVPAGVCGPG